MPRAGFWRARTALKRGTMFEEFVFPLVIAVIALIVAIRANKQTSRLRARIEVLEAQRQTTAAPVAVPPPLPSYEPLRASPEPSRAESAPAPSGHVLAKSESNAKALRALRRESGNRRQPVPTGSHSHEDHSRRLHMKSVRVGLMSLGIVSLCAGTVPALAQDVPDTSFSARIVAGSCDDLAQEPVTQLADLTYGVGEETGTNAASGATALAGSPGTVLVATSVTRLDTAVQDLTGSPHAVAVFSSPTAAASDAVACGLIGGVTPEQNLFFGLTERNDSGYAGVGWLNSGDTGALLTLMLTSLTAPAGVASSNAATSMMGISTAADTTRAPIWTTPSTRLLPPSSERVTQMAGKGESWKRYLKSRRRTLMNLDRDLPLHPVGALLSITPGGEEEPRRQVDKPRSLTHKVPA